MTHAPEALVPGTHSGCLILFFPGLGDETESFDEHAFIQTLRQRGIRGDYAVMETRDYPADDYSDRVEDYVEAHAGERPVWLISVSMGGSAVVRYAATHPNDVEGLVLFAPAIGGPFFAIDIEGAGGPASISEDESNRDLRAARWLAFRDRDDGKRTQLFVAYGDQDSLAPLSEAITDDVRRSGATVLVGGGGHQWTVWRELWRGLVDMGFLQRSCGAPRSRRSTTQDGARQSPAPSR